MTELLSIREYARRRGISHTAVRKRIASGKLTTVDGKINPEAADRTWASSQDPSSLLRQESAARNKSGQTDPSDDTRFGSFFQNRAKRELVRLERETLELAKIKGRLIDVLEVKRIVGKMITATQTAFLAVPPVIAPKIAVESDVQTCQDIVEAAIHECLQKMVGFQPDA